MCIFLKLIHILVLFSGTLNLTGKGDLMENMIFDLDVTFSSKCLGEARNNNISISEMLRAIAVGEVERLDQGSVCNPHFK